MKPLTLALAGALMLTLMAGCSGGPLGSADISIQAPDTPGGEYVFKTGVSADEYSWDLGDHLTVLSGKEVRHAYDIQNGRLQITLRATSGGLVSEYYQDLVLGTGVNTPAAYTLEASRYWASTGEAFTLSAEGSTDPDATDVPRYKWQCYRVELVKVGPHDDGLPGSTVVPPETGTVRGVIANRTLPAPTMTLEGDMCDAINAGPWPSTQATTLGGSFANTGIYTVTLIGSDGANPTVSGNVIFYVGEPGDRPDPQRHETFTGELVGPESPNADVPGIQDACTVPPPGTLDLPRECSEASMSFEIPLNVLGGWINASIPESETSGTAGYRWELIRDESYLLYTGGVGDTHFDKKGTTIYGTYTIKVYGTAGVQIPFNIEFTADLDLNPRTIYEKKP